MHKFMRTGGYYSGDALVSDVKSSGATATFNLIPSFGAWLKCCISA